MRWFARVLAIWFAYGSLVGCDANYVDGTQIFDDFVQFEVALNMYKRDHGMYPSTQSGLAALESNFSSTKAIALKGYVKTLWPDPWENEYQYRSPGNHNLDGYDIWTHGANGASGGNGIDRDCGNWPDSQSKCAEIYGAYSAKMDFVQEITAYLWFAAVSLAPGLPLYCVGIYLRKLSGKPLYVGYHLFAYAYVSLLISSTIVFFMVARAL